MELIEAAREGLIAEVETLLGLGTDRDDLDAALYAAVHHGHVETAKALLAAGADVHADNDRAFYFASRNGNLEMTKLLLGAGANVHAENDTALRHNSVFPGREGMVKILIAAGADVHARNDEALRSAVYNNAVRTVEILLAAGANVHVCDGDLSRAAGRGCTEIVELLVVAGVDVQGGNYSALRNAFNHGHSKIVEILRDAANYEGPIGPSPC